MDRWEHGFSTQKEIFLWLASSRFFDPNRMLQYEEGLPRGKAKAKDDRPMYQNFINFIRSYATTAPQARPNNASSEAIDFFGKRALYTVLLRIAEVKDRIAVFTGTNVGKWTGLQGMLIQLTKEEVKRQLGGDEVLTAVSGIPLDSLPAEDINAVHLTLRVWETTMDGMSIEEIQQMVIRVKGELEAAGKLEYDWRAVKQRKADKQKHEKSTDN